MLEKTRGDIYICIRSRDLQLTGLDGYNNAGRFILFQNIEALKDEQLGVKLQSATIPNSFLIYLIITKIINYFLRKLMI